MRGEASHPSLLDLPWAVRSELLVLAVGIVEGRVAEDGEELATAQVTRYLELSLPVRHPLRHKADERVLLAGNVPGTSSARGRA
jgi:hypothetical protein